MALPSLGCEVLGALLEAGDSFERTARTLALRVAESPRTVETTLRALESWSPPLVEPDPDPGIEVVAWRVTDARRAARGSLRLTVVHDITFTAEAKWVASGPWMTMCR